MKKRFPFWTLGLLGILLVILVPVLYFLRAPMGFPQTPRITCPRSLYTWIMPTSSKANSRPGRT
jgi:hypothetical protein